MLSKILAKPQIAALYRRSTLAPQNLRRFASSEVDLITKEDLGENQAMSTATKPPGHYKNLYLKDVNDIVKGEQMEANAAKADYYDTLNNIDARENFFAKLTS